MRAVRTTTDTTYRDVSMFHLLTLAERRHNSDVTPNFEVAPQKVVVFDPFLGIKATSQIDYDTCANCTVEFSSGLKFRMV